MGGNEDKRNLAFWYKKLDITPPDHGKKGTCLVDYICKAMLDDLAPYYIVREAINDLLYVPKIAQIQACVASPYFKAKFMRQPIVWSEFDRLDVYCLAVLRVLANLKKARTLAAEFDCPVKSLPKFPKYEKREESIELAHLFLGLINKQMTGKRRLGPRAVDKRWYRMLQAAKGKFAAENDFDGHLKRIKEETQLKIAHKMAVPPDDDEGSAFDEDEDDENGPSTHTAKRRRGERQNYARPRTSSPSNADLAGHFEHLNSEESEDDDDDHDYVEGEGRRSTRKRKAVQSSDIATRKRCATMPKHAQATARNANEDMLPTLTPAPTIAAGAIAAERETSDGQMTRERILNERNMPIEQSTAALRSTAVLPKPEPSLNSNTPGSGRVVSMPRAPPLGTAQTASKFIDLTMDDDADVVQVKREVDMISGRAGLLKGASTAATLEDKEEKTKRRRLEKVKLRQEQLDLEEDLENIEEKKQIGMKDNTSIARNITLTSLTEDGSRKMSCTVGRWVGELRIAGVRPMDRKKSLVDYIRKALLGPLAPYFIIREAVNDTHKIVRYSNVYNRLTNPDYEYKYTSSTDLDWTEFDRVDITCLAVWRIIYELRRAPTLAQEYGCAAKNLPQWQRNLDRRDEIRLAYDFLSLVSQSCKGEKFMSPTAADSGPHRALQRAKTAFLAETDFEQHIQRIAAHVRQTPPPTASLPDGDSSDNDEGEQGFGGDAESEFGNEAQSAAARKRRPSRAANRRRVPEGDDTHEQAGPAASSVSGNLFLADTVEGRNMRPSKKRKTHRHAREETSAEQIPASPLLEHPGSPPSVLATRHGMLAYETNARPASTTVKEEDSSDPVATVTDGEGDSSTRQQLHAVKQRITSLEKALEDALELEAAKLRVVELEAALARTLAGSKPKTTIKKEEGDVKRVSAREVIELD
ncbi:hypothetical protein LTR17_006165 [Elasticomyces elasticus]|nr:hypothetical protein LTR17_006165 [Elasticomyces elasticus]